MSIDEMMDAIAQDTIKASMQRDTEKADVYGKCMDLLAKEEKYAWHDLQKNPEDLPSKDGLYAVAIRYGVEPIDIGFGQYENTYGYTSGWSAITNYGSVIAWLEIEPFEEEA